MLTLPWGVALQNIRFQKRFRKAYAKLFEAVWLRLYGEIVFFSCCFSPFLIYLCFLRLLRLLRLMLLFFFCCCCCCGCCCGCWVIVPAAAVGCGAGLAQVTGGVGRARVTGRAGRARVKKFAYVEPAHRLRKSQTSFPEHSGAHGKQQQRKTTTKTTTTTT